MMLNSSQQGAGGLLDAGPDEPDSRSMKTTARRTCRHCGFKPRCLPAELDGARLEHFEHRVSRLPRPVRPGQRFPEHSSALQALYAVRVGALKVVLDDVDGSERVVGFHFPGTIIGLTEVGSPAWNGSFIALQDTWLCRIPIDSIEGAVRRQMLTLVSARLRGGYQQHCSLASKDNAQRLATFLIEFSETLKERGLAPDRFHLPMQYKDIANYLGMRHESLSRTLHDFQARALLRREGNHIHIADLDALRRQYMG